MEKNYEVVIIGGGPAGSSAALYLKEYGFEVCLIEKKIFPRETICGEFLSGEVIKHLKNLNIDKQFLSLNPNSVKSFKVFFENGKSISADFNFGAFAVKRSVFDLLLLEIAKMRGAEIIQPAEAEEITREKEIFSLRVNSDGKEFLLKTRILIAAYGKQNELDFKLNRAFSRIKSPLNGIKYHVDKEYFSSFNDEEIHIYTGNNIYCGLNSVSTDTITLCFLQNRIEPVSYRDGLTGLFKSNKIFNRMLKKNFFDSLGYHKVYGTGNLYLGSKSKVEKGIIMIGDAAGVISPFTGDGIGMAFDSAKLAAECLTLQKDNNMSYDEAISLYERNWRKLFGRRVRISKIIQNFLLKPSLKKIASQSPSLFNIFPSIGSYILKATRS